MRLIALLHSVSIAAAAGAEAAALWAKLALESDSKGWVDTDYKKLIGNTGESERTIRRRLDSLEEKAFISGRRTTGRGIILRISIPSTPPIPVMSNWGAEAEICHPAGGWARLSDDRPVTDGRTEPTESVRSDTTGNGRSAVTNGRSADVFGRPSRVLALEPLENTKKQATTAPPTRAHARTPAGARERIRAAAAGIVPLVDAESRRAEVDRINALWLNRINPKNPAVPVRYGAGVQFSTFNDAGKVIGADALLGAIIEADKKKNAESPIGLLISILAAACESTDERDRLAAVGQAAERKKAEKAARAEALATSKAAAYEPRPVSPPESQADKDLRSAAVYVARNRDRMPRVDASLRAMTTAQLVDLLRSDPRGVRVIDAGNDPESDPCMDLAACIILQREAAEAEQAAQTRLRKAKEAFT